MPSFSNLKGFFFYQSIVRKDLLNKLVLSDTVFIPAITKTEVSISTNQKLQEVGMGDVFSWVCLLEMLGGSVYSLEFGDLLQVTHFTSLRNFKLSVNFLRFDIYEFFFQIFFLWFKGLAFPTEEFRLKARLSKKKVENVKLKFKKNKNSIKVIYLKYVAPKLKIPRNKTKTLVSHWSDFTFCVFIPINVTDMCMNDSFKMQFVFNTSLMNYKVLLLSGMRLLHRFSISKNY